MSTLIPCDIYRSRRVEGMYLYVGRGDGLSRVPEALLQRFGRPELAMRLLLAPERRLARASATEVIRGIAACGYYLQMPPLAGQGVPE